MFWCITFSFKILKRSLPKKKAQTFRKERLIHNVLENVHLGKNLQNAIECIIRHEKCQSTLNTYSKCTRYKIFLNRITYLPMKFFKDELEELCIVYCDHCAPRNI